ncbi:MAG: hypothetical protein M1819_001357 [Sarea resinae]|nr:MAG: hypothetical protein M1819_001357 [Sarea resinae]
MASSTMAPYKCFSCHLRVAGKGCFRRPFSSCTPRAAIANRPSNAPKPSIDIKHIRQNPDLYTRNCQDRNYQAQSSSSSRIIKLFDEWQSLQKSARGLRERNNDLRRRLTNPPSVCGESSTEAKSRDVLLEEARALKVQLSEIEAKEESLTSEIEDLALELPNLTSPNTPTGAEPKLLGYINEHPEPSPSSSDRVWRSHVHIGSELELLNFAAAAKSTGWGWYYLVNEAALLEQALIQYALSLAIEKGWRVVSPPSIVYSHIANACGFRPRDQNGEQQIYALEQPEKDKRKPELSLAGTAEIPLAAMKATETLDEEALPLKTIGVSRSYRAEAGARGVDTKGLYRVHEFTKVEMFAWTMPDAADANEGAVTESQSTALFDEMLALQTTFLQSLNLHCRILEMPSLDLGASATRKIDIEAFFPSRRAHSDGWGELSSLSLCTDYQTRRLGTRVRVSGPRANGAQGGNAKVGGGAAAAAGAGSRLDYPWTLNGTAVAVPRVVAALLENGWDEDRAVVAIPEVLRRWMPGGMKEIRRAKR